MRRALIALAALLVAVPAAADWEFQPHVQVTLFGVDLTHRQIGLQLAPAVGIAYTDGTTYTSLALEFGVQDTAAFFTPMLLVGSNELLISAGIGYRFREPLVPRQPWRTSWLLGFGGGTPFERIRS